MSLAEASERIVATATEPPAIVSNEDKNAKDEQRPIMPIRIWMTPTRKRKITCASVTVSVFDPGPNARKMINRSRPPPTKIPPIAATGLVPEATW